jgi:hypothetical protein
MTTTPQDDNRRPMAQPLLDYLLSNADRPITLRELEREFPSRTVSGAISRFVDVYPNLERKQRGIYIWHSVPRTDQPTELLLKIVKRNEDNRLLAVDEDNGTVYILKEVDF